MAENAHCAFLTPWFVGNHADSGQPAQEVRGKWSEMAVLFHQHLAQSPPASCAGYLPAPKGEEASFLLLTLC